MKQFLDSSRYTTSIYLFVCLLNPRLPTTGLPSQSCFETRGSTWVSLCVTRHTEESPRAIHHYSSLVMTLTRLIRSKLSPTWLGFTDLAQSPWIWRAIIVCMIATRLMWRHRCHHIIIILVAIFNIVIPSCILILYIKERFILFLFLFFSNIKLRKYYWKACTYFFLFPDSMQTLSRFRTAAPVRVWRSVDRVIRNIQRLVEHLCLFAWECCLCG